MNNDFLKILFKNKTARNIFNIKKKLFKNSYTYNELLENSDLFLQEDKKSVLYVVFNRRENFDNEIHYLCRVEVVKNEFGFVGLHRHSTANEKLNIKYSHESYIVDYMYKYDRNMSLHFGSCEYI